MIKNTIFLFVLLFTGCGVMNNPDTEIGVPAGAITNDKVLKVSRISTESLILDGIGDMDIPELSSYRIFATSTLTEEFLTDLNSSAQTLANGDLSKVEGWIKNIKDANINYQINNLLFYPILQSQDCGLKESIAIKDNNASITIQNSRLKCDEAFIYHIMLYKVDKSIKNILIKAFDEENVTISNITE